MWYLYSLHWHVLEDGATVTAAQDTYVKRSTALSWETASEDQRFVVAGTSLRASHLGPVRNERERQRHAGSRDHLEVDFSPRSWETLERSDARWLIYWPHWRSAAGAEAGAPAAVTARCDTWLKRACTRSTELQAHEKLSVSAGEVLRTTAAPRELSAAAVATGGAAFAAEHREVEVSTAEVARLRSVAPRLPLCKYFTSDPEALRQDIRSCFADGEFGPGALPRRACDEGQSGKEICPDFALLLPHGGYCNSGFVAAHGFKLLADTTPSVVVVIGNNHQAWHKTALSDQIWTTPLGRVFPAAEPLEALQKRGYAVDRHVHAEEHSIENQLPFLQYVCPAARIVPVGVGAVTLDEAQQLASTLAELVRTSRAALVGTTDFSHEGPSYGGPVMSMEEVTALTRSKDEPLLDAVRDMDAARLLEVSRGSSMCGAGAAAVLLLCCQELGLQNAELLRYLVNTEVTPCGSTTGFASFVFRRGASSRGSAACGGRSASRCDAGSTSGCGARSAIGCGSVSCC